MFASWVLVPKTSAFQPNFATEVFVVLVGNDPTTSSMSRKCSPIELQNNFELLTGNDPISLVYKTSASPLMLKKLMSTERDSNPR
jgi:hypothetical protein